jgi:dienelactone hydrolase
MKLGASDVPSLLAHPSWPDQAIRPAPVMFWMHGRTVNKELDPGRYLRWLRAGIATCAIDLPGHGERFDAGMQGPERTLDMIEQARHEIDSVLDALRSPLFKGAFDLSRVGIGGMSAGGMVTLRRLCDSHTFTCAAVEATTGWLEGLYYPERVGMPRRTTTLPDHPLEKLRGLDPNRHLGDFRPIPLLELHSEADRVVPWAGMKIFLANLRDHYIAMGRSETPIEVLTWPSTGAPEEHNGFGRVSNDAKNAQTRFLTEYLKPLG